MGNDPLRVNIYEIVMSSQFTLFGHFCQNYSRKIKMPLTRLELFQCFV